MSRSARDFFAGGEKTRRETTEIADLKRRRVARLGLYLQGLIIPLTSWRIEMGLFPLGMR